MVIGKPGSRKYPRKDFGKESDFIDSHHLSPVVMSGRPGIQWRNVEAAIPYCYTSGVEAYYDELFNLIRCRFHFPDVRSPHP